MAALLARRVSVSLLLAAPGLAEKPQKTGNFVHNGLAEGLLRLTSSVDSKNGHFAGRLQINHLGQWGSVCEEGFSGRDEPEVACRQLGLGSWAYYYDYNDILNNDDFLWKFPRTEEDTGLIWHSGEFGCDDDNPTILDCEWERDWGDHQCSSSDDAIIFCDYPSKPLLQEPNFVLDIGFSRSETTCVSVQGDLQEYAFERTHTHGSDRRRRHGTRQTTTTTTWAPIANSSTAAACMSVYHGGVQPVEQRFVDGEWKPDPQEIFDISYQADDQGPQVCVRRTDGKGAWWGYLRLLCQFVDLTSPLVSYKVKGGCGPSGGDVQVDASECANDVKELYTIRSDDGSPVAVVEDCLVVEYTVHECAAAAPVAEEPACDDFSPEGGGSWHDADGAQFDCAWYNRSSFCSTPRLSFGHSAAEACCSCGGGTQEVKGAVAFRSAGTMEQVENATRSALSELLGVDVSALVLSVMEGESRTTMTVNTTVTATSTLTVDCYWVVHSGVYSAGYADGHSNNYDLAGAQAKCLDLGASCPAVTCSSSGQCTVRASTYFQVSPFGETTYDYYCFRSSTTTATASNTTTTEGTLTATTVTTDPNASVTGTTGSTTLSTVTSTVTTAETFWWSADYSLSLSLGHSRAVVARGASPTGTEGALAQSFAAAGLLFHGATLLASAPQLATRPVGPAAPAAAAAEEEKQADESGLPTGAAVGIGVGAAALALGGAAAALALRSGRYARWTQTGQGGDGTESLRSPSGASEVAGSASRSRVFDV